MIRWQSANEHNKEFQMFSEKLKSNQHFQELNIWAQYSQKLREFMQLTLVILVSGQWNYKAVHQHGFICESSDDASNQAIYF